MKTLILAPCCVIVKGKNYSCIYDLQRNGIYRFPNSFLPLFEDTQNTGIWSISTDYSSADQLSFVEGLKANQLCVSTSMASYFRPLSTEYKSERICENAIIDRYANSAYSMELLSSKLSSVACAAICLRYFQPMMLSEIELDVIAFSDSTVRSIEIHFSNSEKIDLSQLKEFKRKHGRVCSFVMYSQEKNRTITIGDGLTIQLKATDLEASRMCGGVTEAKMRAQTQLYLESMNYNNCLHRKVYIGRHGEVKNCPAMVKTYGKIESPKMILAELFNTSEFRKCWYITKDKVDTCQDCEFRYACIDCRCFLQTPDERFSKPCKCQYIP